MGTLAGGLGPALAGERLLDGGRRAASAEASQQLTAETELIIAGLNTIATDELPVLRTATGLSGPQFDQLLAERFPAVANGLVTLSDGGNLLRKTTANLASLSADFEQADALPVASVPLPVAALGFAAFGVVMALCGAFAWWSAARWPLVVIAAVCVAAGGANLATRSPQKAAAAERVIGRVNLSSDITGGMQRHLDAVGGFLAEYRSQLIPAVGGGDGAKLTAQLDAAFPAAARLCSAEGAAALASLQRNIDFRKSNVDNFASIDSLPVSALLWAATALFAVVAAAALAALLEARSTGAEARRGA